MVVSCICGNDQVSENKAGGCWLPVALQDTSISLTQQTNPPVDCNLADLTRSQMSGKCPLLKVSVKFVRDFLISQALSQTKFNYDRCVCPENISGTVCSNVGHRAFQLKGQTDRHGLSTLHSSIHQKIHKNWLNPIVFV